MAEATDRPTKAHTLMAVTNWVLREFLATVTRMTMDELEPVVVPWASNSLVAIRATVALTYDWSLSCEHVLDLAMS